MANSDNLPYDQNREGDSETLLSKSKKSPDEILAKMNDIALKISQGATTFLVAEYSFLALFTLGFAVVVHLCASPTLTTFYTPVAFIIGSLTSIICGFIGMRAAVYSNVRTTK